jgi:hypothetical protein
MLCACADAPVDETLDQRLAQRGYQQGEPVKEIRNYTIDGWNFIDDRHIVLHSGPGRDYMVSLTMRCVNLGNSENIAFTSTNAALTPLDNLLVHRDGFEDICPIHELRVLTHVQASSGMALAATEQAVDERRRS